MLGFTPLSAAPISSTGERIVEASAAILGRAIVTATSGAVEGSAAITGRATVSALAYRIVDANASITCAATVVADGGFIIEGTAAITSSATVAADGFVDAEQPIEITSKATVSCVAVVNHFTASSSMRSAANVSAIGYIFGEEWTKQAAGSDIWLKQG